MENDVMTIKNYADVAITIESARISALGFNTCLILFESDTLDRAKIVSTSDYADADLGGTSSELYKAFQSYLSQGIIAGTVVVGCKKTTDATWADAITAIRAANDSWYGIIMVNKTKADIVSVAAVVETIEPGRQLFAVTADAAVAAKTSGNVAETLKTAGYYRTNLIYSTDTAAYANAAMASYLSYNPGSITFNFKELVGVAAETLTAAERQNLIDQNCQVQREEAGLKRTLDSGMTVNGEFIDIMHGLDWLTARIAEGVFSILASAPKVPLTDGGIAQLAAEVTRNLSIGATDPYNYIRDDYTVYVPSLASLSSSDRNARKVTGLRFVAHPQGAVHFVEIRGKLVI